MASAAPLGLLAQLPGLAALLSPFLCAGLLQLSVPDRSGACVVFWCSCSICSTCISRSLLRLIISVKSLGCSYLQKKNNPLHPSRLASNRSFILIN